MAGSTYMGLAWLLLMLASHASGYQIYNVEDPGVCNGTIWLDQGPNSAAILRLTARSFYDHSPTTCIVIFKAPMHKWSGLLGVLEDVDLRMYKDVLSQSVCIDYVTITTPVSKEDGGSNHGNPYQQEQCGSWSVGPGGNSLPRLGYNKVLVGHCAYNSMQCEPVRELEVRVVIGRYHERQYLWSNLPTTRNKGFTFVVTAYSFSYSVITCPYELQSCGDSGSRNTPLYCIHDSLFCDGHINCGQATGPLDPLSTDERSCRQGDLWIGRLTATAGPWVGAGVLLLLVLCIVIHKNKARARQQPIQQQQQYPLQQLATPQEFNSYAESYEVSSNMSSAPHMAIQVRVVCNTAGQQWPASSGGHSSIITPWKPDMPPSYETLFPQGPPQQVPPLNHSPQFAGTSTAAALGSIRSVNNSLANTANIASFNRLGQACGSTVVASTSHQPDQQTAAEASIPFDVNRSLDRRVPIKRECSRSSLLSHGVRIHAPIVDAFRLTLNASEPPDSPPSYDSDNYTSTENFGHFQNAYCCNNPQVVPTSYQCSNNSNVDSRTQQGNICQSNFSDQNCDNEVTGRSNDESHGAEDEMTSSGVSENTHYQSCSEHNESHDESCA